VVEEAGPQPDWCATGDPACSGRDSGEPFKRLGLPSRQAIGRPMTVPTAEQLAQIIIDSIDRHGLRGLIYESDGVVVMHGKVDMVAVASDVIAAMTEAR
jgi:hypothetical protein